MPQPRDWNNVEQVTAWVREQIRAGRPIDQIRSEIVSRGGTAGVRDLAVGQAREAEGEQSSSLLSDIRDVATGRPPGGDTSIFEGSPLGGRRDGGKDESSDDPATQATEAALEDGEVSEEEAGGLLDILAGSAGTAPPELTRFLGGRPLAADEVQDAIDIYNSMSPNPVTSAQELFDRWSSNDALAWESISSIRAGETSEWMQVSIGTSGGGRPRTHQIQSNHYLAFQSNFNGFAQGQGAVFTAVERNKGRAMDAPASAYAGALAVLGGFGPAKSSTTKFQQDIDEEINSQLRAGAIERLRRQNPDGFRRFSDDEIAAEIEEWDAEEGDGPTEIRRRLQSGLEIDRGINGATNQRVRNEQATRTYDQFYARYHNHGLALVAMRNPKVAEQIYNSGKVDGPDQARYVQQVFLDAGYRQDQWEAQGDAFDGAMWDALLSEADPSLAGGDSGAPVIDVTLPDPTAIHESMRTLYRAWFRRDPTQAELDAFTGEINGAIQANAETRAGAARQQTSQGFDFATGRFRGASQDPIISTVNDVNAESRLMARARQSEEYGRLFNKKPQGLSEEQYVALFDQAADRFAPTSLVGDDAVRSGMETGRAQTTVGRIFGDSQVWQDDSTFLQRMTNAARAVARMT